MKIGLKRNTTKVWLDNEIRNKQEYMAKIGPGEEYQNCLDELQTLVEMRESMSLGNKILKYVPVLTAIGAIGAAIGVPLYGMHMTYQKQEVENELPNGDIRRLAEKSINTRVN